ncbi:MAG: cytochrome d ubiquinol oxidase subunit II [Actinomycetaceae bacterium]|nr:cytochrome d ubiquinol oxidase subunit II [Actinomycetaceae bacterium]
MTLAILWFILIAVLWTAYLVLEGFDFGVGMVLPIFGKSDVERTQIVRTIGPHWDGNEVWLLTAGGATFAAFPEWYATMFSGMYLALFLILVLLILRISALEWRSKIATEKWRLIWDQIHAVTAFGVPLLLGVAFANLVQGMQIEVVGRDGAVIPAAQAHGALASASHQLTGGFFSLLTPYTLLGGLTVLAICFAHGSQFLALKTEGAVRDRANAAVPTASLVAAVLGATFVLWGQVAFSANVLSWIPLLIAAVGLLGAAAFSQTKIRSEGKSFICSCVAIAAAVAWVFATGAPAVMKSAIDPAYSLTIDQAAATGPTLLLMTIVTGILLPLVIAYIVWSYWVFRHRVSTKDVTTNAGLLPKKIRLGENFLTG